MMDTSRFTRLRLSLVVPVVALAAIAAGGCGDEESATDSATTTTVATTTAATGADCTSAAPASKPDRPTFTEAPPMTIDASKTYTATIETSCGTIVVALDAKAAPKGVNNFVFLAKEGFYDGLTWHRVSPDFVIQGGDPTGDGSGGPGYTVVTETPTDAYAIGDVAYAKFPTDPAGTAGSQFFVITGGGNPQLPPDYGRFGHVTEGQDVAKKIESFNQGDGPPTQPLYIEKVTITEQ